MRVGWKYLAVAKYEDGTEEPMAIRFPSKGWWLFSARALISPGMAKRGPVRLKDGSRAWHRPDGAIEFREPWHD